MSGTELVMSKQELLVAGLKYKRRFREACFIESESTTWWKLSGKPNVRIWA